MATCGHDRPIPRTQTSEFAIQATQGDNQHTPKAFFEEEQKQVDQGILELENTLLADVQEDDTDPQLNTRPVPENFKRQRA